MTRIPTGSWPPGRLTRNVVLADFDSPRASPGGSGTLIPGAQYISPVWDVLTPLYRGRGSSTGPIAETQGWTRSLGTPGAVFGASAEFRVGAVYLDASCWTIRACSILFEWIYHWTVGAPAVGASYLWLPVKGSAAPSLDLVPVSQMVELRIPTPWFRWTLTNEDTIDLAFNTDTFLFLWLRGE